MRGRRARHFGPHSGPCVCGARENGEPIIETGDKSIIVPAYERLGTQRLVPWTGGAGGNELGQLSVAGLVRARWLSLLLVTVLTAAPGLVAIWWAVRPKYEVAAMVHVAPVVRPILFSDADVDITRNYRQYVLTEAANITGTAVLEAATSLPAVRVLPLVANNIDPVAAIQSAISALPLSGTELLKVSMVGENPSELATLIDGILATYLSRREATTREWDEKILSSLKSEQTELGAKLKVKGQQLRETSVEAGLSGADDIGQLIDRWMSEIQDQLTESKKEKALAESRLAALDSEVNGSESGVSEAAAFEELLGRDPELHGLKEQLRTVELVALGDGAAGRGPGHPEVQSRPAVIASLNTRIDQRGASLHKTFVSSRRREFQGALRTAEVTTRVLEQELQKLGDRRAGLAGQRFVLDDIRHERERLEHSLNQVREKIWNVEVEQNRSSRITIDSPARVPASPNLDKRLKYAAAVMAVSLALGMGTAFLRHRMDRSFQEPTQVTQGLGVRVLGSVQRLDDREAPLEAFDERLVEPMRGISTALLANPSGRGARTRLITSPTPGSGKTSLALHVAKSLAATGRRVLLVDADNHGQGITRRLRMQDQHGLWEFLLGRVSAADAVYTGEPGSLHILPAGARAEEFGDLLRSKPTAERLQALFASYDEVIVDSPPVLVKSDAVALATLVGEVVLVLRAGQSTQEEAHAAQQYLTAVGGNVVGVILNAVDPRRVRYGYHYNYSYSGQD